MIVGLIGLFIGCFILIACIGAVLGITRWALVGVTFILTTCLRMIFSSLWYGVTLGLATWRGRPKEEKKEAVGSTVRSVKPGQVECPKCNSSHLVQGQHPEIGGSVDRGLVFAHVGIVPDARSVGKDLICMSCGHAFVCQKKHVRTS